MDEPNPSDEYFESGTGCWSQLQEAAGASGAFECFVRGTLDMESGYDVAALLGHSFLISPICAPHGAALPVPFLREPGCSQRIVAMTRFLATLAAACHGLSVYFVSSRIDALSHL